MSPLRFEWDNGNEKKSEEKHLITNAEAESVFKDRRKLILISHRLHEVRFLCTGKVFWIDYLHLILSLGMEKSESWEHGLRGKRKERGTLKANDIFYVSNLSGSVGLKDFDPDLKISLSATLKLSKKKIRLTKEDIPLILLR